MVFFFSSIALNKKPNVSVRPTLAVIQEAQKITKKAIIKGSDLSLKLGKNVLIFSLEHPRLTNFAIATSGVVSAEHLAAVDLGIKSVSFISKLVQNPAAPDLIPRKISGSESIFPIIVKGADGNCYAGEITFPTEACPNMMEFIDQYDKTCSGEHTYYGTDNPVGSIPSISCTDSSVHISSSNIHLEMPAETPASIITMLQTQFSAFFANWGKTASQMISNAAQAQADQAQCEQSVSTFTTATGILGGVLGLVTAGLLLFKVRQCTNKTVPTNENADISSANSSYQTL